MNAQKTPTRIYRVISGHGDRLVRAPTASQAIRHVVSGTFSTRVASQDDLESMLGMGIKVEVAGAQGEKCESGDPSCGPVVTHDSEGVPLCQKCADELAAEASQG